MIVILHSLACAREHLASVNGISDRLVALSSWFYAGVPFFFVISGFCIAACADSVRRKSVHSPRVFFLRRFRRIYPPFWAALALVGVTYTIVNFIYPNYFSGFRVGYALPRELSVSQWLGNLTLTEEWRHHLLGDVKKQMLGPAWSLCYEEQFYAVVGLILLCARRWFFTGAAAITALTVLSKHALPPIGLDTRGFFFDGGWLQFAAGILVYYSLNYLSPKKLWWSYLVLTLGIPYALRGKLGVGSTVESDLVQSLVFAILILALAPKDKQFFQSKMLKPFLWCGTMCYSLYLIHLPVTTLLSRFMYNSLHMTDSYKVLLFTLPLCVAASLVIGWLFFHIIEKKCLNTPVV
jgi:peptidoglycan/LPS O-acetylase OafA/YrhL